MNDLAGMRHATVIPDGRLWQVVTLVSRTHIDPMGQTALGLTPRPFTGLSRADAGGGKNNCGHA